jgi:hypothetical protein
MHSRGAWRGRRHLSLEHYVTDSTTDLLAAYDEATETAKAPHYKATETARAAYDEAIEAARAAYREAIARAFLAAWGGGAA